jgi:LysM repeat protein
MPERISRDTFRDKRGIETEQGPDEDYSPEDAYSPWKKGNVESFMSNLSKNSGLLLVIIGAAVFVLIAFFVFMPMLRNPAETKPQNTEMEAKLKKMENKLVEMEQNYHKVAQLALQDDKIEQISARLDKLGASTTQRLDQMTKDIDALHKQPALPKTESAPKQPPAQPKTESAPKQPPAPPKTESASKQPAAPKAEPAPKQPAAAKAETPVPAKANEAPEKKAPTEKYHEVKPLETLYGIGKTYGLTVDELKRLNNIAPTDNTVRTGQKLKVSN